MGITTERTKEKAYNYAMRKNGEIVVVGGGVIGLSSAIFLAREGRQITVLDNSSMKEKASWAGAGILPPGNSSMAATPRDWLRAKSAEMFPSFSRELKDLTGMENGFRVCGGLEILCKKDNYWEKSLNDEGIAFEYLESSSILKKFPGLSSDIGLAYFLPGMAQVRNPWHMRALKTACQNLGVRFLDGSTAKGFQTSQSKVTAVVTNDGSIEADLILLAGGAWTGNLLQSLGFENNVIPIRGQIVLVKTEHPLVPIVLSGKNYLVPRGDGLVLIGSTEENAGFSRETTAEGKSGLLDFAKRVCPEIGKGQVIHHWAGLRPKSKTRGPLIGQLENMENLYVATGHFRSGLQMSLGTALLISQLMLGFETDIPLNDFSLNQPTAGEAPLLFHS